MATPTPLKLRATCGFTGSLLAIVKVPVRVPAACGVKLSVRIQKPPGARGAVQFGRLKLKSAPVIVVFARSICSGAPPVFSMNSWCAGAACPTSTGSKVSGPPEIVMTGTTPVPESCRLLTGNGALVVKARLAMVLTAATGVNVTGKVQVAFGATGAAHSVASTVKTGSLETAEVSDNGAVPQFVRTTEAVADCPTRVGVKPRPKARLLGRQTAGASAFGSISAANPKLADVCPCGSVATG